MGAQQPSRSGLGQAARYLDLGLRFVVSCLGGAALGWWLDQKYEPTGRFPLLTLVGFFLGFVAGMVTLLRGFATGAPPRDKAGEDGG